jgi:hypothetical protein
MQTAQKHLLCHSCAGWNPKRIYKQINVFMMKIEILKFLRHACENKRGAFGLPKYFFENRYPKKFIIKWKYL